MSDIESLRESLERDHGGLPGPELLELCSRFSFLLKEISVDHELYYRHQNLDLVRLSMAAKLLEFAGELVHLDRNAEGPDFFGTVRPHQRQLPPEPPPKRKAPPLTKHLQEVRKRLNGHGWDGRE